MIAKHLQLVKFTLMITAKNNTKPTSSSINASCMFLCVSPVGIKLSLKKSQNCPYALFDPLLLVTYQNPRGTWRHTLWLGQCSVVCAEM